MGHSTVGLRFFSAASLAMKAKDDKFSLHHYLRHAANEIREKVPNHFRHKPLAEAERGEPRMVRPSLGL